MSEQQTSETVSTWYHVDKWSNVLKPVPVFKETEHFIYAKHWDGQKEPNRISKTDHYPTWEQAKAAKVRHIQEQIACKRQEIETLLSNLSAVEALTP